MPRYLILFAVCLFAARAVLANQPGTVRAIVALVLALLVILLADLAAYLYRRSRKGSPAS